jgi:hypothetical protein
MTKRNLLKFHCFGHWNISVFVIVSDFEIRISNFLPKNRGFRSDTKYAEIIAELNIRGWAVIYNFAASNPLTIKKTQRSQKPGGKTQQILLP